MDKEKRIYKLKLRRGPEKAKTSKVATLVARRGRFVEGALRKMYYSTLPNITDVLIIAVPLVNIIRRYIMSNM